MSEEEEGKEGEGEGAPGLYERRALVADKGDGRRAKRAET